MSEQKEKSVGAIWKRKSKNGNTYLSIQMIKKGGEKVNLIAFENSYKDEQAEGAPDFNVFVAKPLENSGGGKPKSASRPKARPAPQPPQEEDFADSPF